jgi:hypothetical protein
MTTTILSTITDPPMNIVHSGALLVSSAAARSHAKVNATTAITRRDTCDSLRFATAAAKSSTTRVLANTARGAIEDVTAGAPSRF